VNKQTEEENHIGDENKRRTKEENYMDL
jgi:hypothetical protein